MKMCCFSSGLFWGILLILMGLVIIIKVLFNISIPLFRIGFAILLIYFGIKVLTGRPLCSKGKNAVWFNDTKIENTASSDKYDIIFGKGVIDLSNLSLTGGTLKKEINTIFAAGIVKINPQIPVKIMLNSAFAGAKMPDGNVTSFGKYIYNSANYREDQNHLEINANAVFASLEIISK